MSHGSCLTYTWVMSHVTHMNGGMSHVIEKVAETYEFDGKEPLFVERTIAISMRVLGWEWRHESCHKYEWVMSDVTHMNGDMSHVTHAWWMSPPRTWQCRFLNMGWLRLVGSLKLQVSFAEEPYKLDDILWKRPIIWRSLLIVATP